MDVDTDIPQVQHSEHARTTLRRIEATAWKPERLQWLWEQTLKEDYASDDIGTATPEIFISNLFMGNTRHYEYGDDAYIAILNIIPRTNADMHFAVWGEVPLRDVVACHTTLAEEMFNELEVNRLTAYIPSFNKKMVRFATVLGYKYEGEIRQIFLKNGVYHNMFVYGLLKSEWLRRKVG